MTNENATAKPAQLLHPLKFAITSGLLIVAITASAAAPNPSCALPDAQSLPSVKLCLNQWLSASAKVPGDPSTLEALYALADERVRTSSLEDAEAVLNCAAAQIRIDSSWRARYEVIRRYGIVEYKRDKIAVALGRFECALNLAEEHGDRAAVTKQLKNVGSSLRRIGDYDAALNALTRSLEMQRADGDAATGPVLNNIADVFRESGRPLDAEHYYGEALEVFRRARDLAESMHVFDSLSALVLERGDVAAAKKLLQSALHDLRKTDNRSYQLSVLAGLAHIAILDGDVERARSYSADGLALAERYDLPVPLELDLETARADRLSGRFEPAMARLQDALAKQPAGNATRAALMQELATTFQETGRNAEALAQLRQAHEIELRDVREQNSQQLGWLHERFDAAERERTIASLLNENRRRSLLLWLTAVSALAALLTLSLFFLRRQQRTRLAEAEKEVRYAEMLAHYRREANALAEDGHLLQTLLDSRDDALCLLDTDGQVLAVNRAAAALLGVEREKLAGGQLSEHLTDDDDSALKVALENMEDAPSQSISIAARAGDQKLHADLMQWEHGNGLIVMHLREVAAIAAAAQILPEAATQAMKESIPDVSIPMHSAEPDDDARENFRRALVALMLAVVDAWERCTSQNRIELAERSRIWRVNIDDGRLRARAMERYLSVSKLPQNPRWRDVLRSAYYVLGQCALETAQRDDLQQRVDAVLAYTRRGALV